MPHSQQPGEDADVVYAVIGAELAASQTKGYHIGVAGDFIAEIGTSTEGDNESTIGLNPFNARSSRDDKLLSYYTRTLSAVGNYRQRGLTGMGAASNSQTTSSSIGYCFRPPGRPLQLLIHRAIAAKARTQT